MTDQYRPGALLSVCISCIAAGALIGVSTNAVNGAISPDYFRGVMRWHEIEAIWRASVAQGLIEGLVYGVVFSAIFTAVVGRVSRVRCPTSFALSHLAGIVGAVYCCWVLGGAIAVGIAAWSPEFFRKTFVGVPEEVGPMLRYAWVGGSVWGAMLGGVLAVVVGSFLFGTRWRRRQGECVS